MISKSILALAAAVALLMPSLVPAQVSMEKRLAPGQPPVVVARSKTVESGYPEQSLAGFEWAINPEFDGGDPDSTEDDVTSLDLGVFTAVCDAGAGADPSC